MGDISDYLSDLGNLQSLPKGKYPATIEPDMWTTADGSRIPVSGMTDAHLHYALAKAYRGEYPDSKSKALGIEGLKREAARRLAPCSTYPEAHEAFKKGKAEGLQEVEAALEHVNELDSENKCLRLALQVARENVNRFKDQLADARAKNVKLNQIAMKYRQTRAGLGLPPVEF